MSAYYMKILRTRDGKVYRFDPSCLNWRLIESITRGNLEKVKKLLDGGASPNHRADLPYEKLPKKHLPNESHLGPLLAAILHNKPLIVELLLERGADPNGVEVEVDYDPLLYATKLGRYEIVKMLLENGCDPNMKRYNSGGFSAIHYSTKSVPMMIAFIRAGADINAKTECGEQLLHIACHYGHVDAVKYLVAEAEVDIKAQCKRGRDARWYARDTSLFTRKKPESIVEILEILEMLDSVE